MSESFVLNRIRAKKNFEADIPRVPVKSTELRPWRLGHCKLLLLCVVSAVLVGTFAFVVHHTRQNALSEKPALSIPSQLHQKTDADIASVGKQHHTADDVDVGGGSERKDLCDKWFCKGSAGLESWFLPIKLPSHSRNGECRILEDKKLVSVLGRHSRSVETLDLETGELVSIVTEGTDPAGWPLSDLNHVYGVQVASLDDEEVEELWLPCGFHGDKVNGETSSRYARIVNLKTMQVKLGPKLPVAGGACSALGLELDGPGTPKHICVFGGTNGTHNTGTFLADCRCYDRVKREWVMLPALPYGLDHSNAVLLPAVSCSEGQHPARLLVLNFRVENYGSSKSQILALDVPALGTAKVDLDSLRSGPGWYVYADPGRKSPGEGGTATVEELTQLGRDAAAVVTAGGGRYVLTLGGIHHKFQQQPGTLAEEAGVLYASKKKPPYSLTFQQVRMLDLCAAKKGDGWKLVGRMAASRFAIQSCSTSSKYNMVATCGGETLRTDSTRASKRTDCEMMSLDAMLVKTDAASLRALSIDPRR